MLSSFLSIVDSVLTLDEGYSRKDIISGDLVVIDGNLNKDVAGRITGTAALACICSADKNKKFYIIIGKHKIELQGSMDMNPKPLSVVNPNHTTVRVTNDQNRYFEMRFNDAMSFSAWLPKLGEVLAESMCNEVLSSHHTANSIACLNMRRCIHTCELLTSPSKTYVRRVSEIYGIRRKLMEVMGTLRSNPCDVNIKDLRSLKELCWKYPEMQSDPDMKFLLERMPSDRYSSEDLQVILKDILYADSGEGSHLACAHVYHGTSSADLHNQDTSLAVVRAVLVQDAHVPVSSDGLSDLNRPTVDGQQESGDQNSTASSVTAPSTANTDTTTHVSVPVHRKSRIVLNGVEIQSSARSPSSAGKALSKQIKIKSKFTTPAQIRKEVARPKTKTPPSNKKILLSDVQYNVSPLPNSAISVLSSPVPASTLASERTPVRTPVAPLSAMKPSSGKVFTPVAAQLDKENLPTPHKNVTPMTMPRSALKKPSSTGKSTQHKLTFAANLDDSGDILQSAAILEEQTVPIQVNSEHETMPFSSILAMEIVPELIAPVESTFNTPMHHFMSKVPFASPTATQDLVQNVANLFEDAVMYNVTAPHNPELLTFTQGIYGSPQPLPVMTRSTGIIDYALNQFHQKRVATSIEKLKTEACTEDSTGTFDVDSQVAEPTVESFVEPLALEVFPTIESSVEASVSVPPVSLEFLTAPIATPARAPPVPLDRPLSPPTTTGRKSGSKKQLNAVSMQESTTPAKSHRAMHLTTPSTTGVSAATAVPRTPAPLLSSATSEINLPVPTPVSISMHPVAVSKQESTSKVEAKLASESLHWRRDTSWKMGILGLCVVLVALFAAQFTIGTKTVIVAPLAGSDIVQVRAQAMTPLANVSSVDSTAMDTAEAAQPHARPFQPVDATIMPLPAVAAAQHKENGFEMRVRFADAATTQTDSAYEPNNRPVPQKPTLLSAPQHSMQRHNVSPLLAQWRRLQRLLTVPAKYARMLLNTAWKKFDRVRKVLAE